ncbi:MAG TPA: hypothetical protein VMW04_03030 [Patescibacteria group bacterium]|nr:hypothetical protein [Patescibacteria group bacterium]
MKFFKVIIPLSFVFLFINATSTLAYKGSTNLDDYEKALTLPDLNLESHTNETYKDLAISVIKSIAPSENTNKSEGGALTAVGNLIVSMYTNPPASSIEYFAYLGRNFGLVKPAYAQGGIGFRGLSSLLPLWRASRNLAYLFFVLIFLFTGLAIMFRVKIDPKTAVTIQNSIPKLVIALILVTFSYAIAGLLIDLIYVLIYVGVLIIGQSGLLGSMAEIAAEQRKFVSLGFGEAYGLVLGGGIKAVWEGVVVKTFFAGLNPNILVGILAGIGGVIFTLIFLIIALYLVLKLFFNLLKSYISIIVSVIIGPIQILLGAVPGSKGGFGAWFLNLLANVLVFPAVALFLLLASVIIEVGKGPTWTPPVLGVGGGALTAILGLGLLMAVGSIPNVVLEAFKAAGFGTFGTAIGQTVGWAQGTISGGVDRTLGPQIGAIRKIEEGNRMFDIQTARGLKPPGIRTPLSWWQKAIGRL